MSDCIELTCKAILFDMDGTLVDSTPVVERAWGWWAQRHGISLPALLAYSHGRPTAAAMEHFFPGRDHRAELEEMASYEEGQVEGIRAVPGALQTVLALSDRPWAVVTSAWRILAEARIVAAGLPLPRVLVPINEISRGKPHPEGFLRAAELLGLAAEECLVFEDTRPGIDAGLSAGMQVVGLLTTASANALQYRPAVRDFRDVSIELRGDRIAVHIRSDA